MERVLTLLRRSAWLVVLGSLGIAAAAVLQIFDFEAGKPRLRVDPSVNRLLPQDDDARVYYDEVKRTFGNDEALLVVIEDDALFSPAKLEQIALLSERIEEVLEVDRVVSLATSPDLRSIDGAINVAPFLDELPIGASEATAMGERVRHNPLYAGNLVSRDLRSTALYVYFREMDEREFVDRGLDRQIAALAEETVPGSTILITGPPRLKAETSRTLLADLALVVPLAFVLALSIAWLSFRSLRAVLIPAGTIVLALLTMLGAMAAAGRMLNLVTTVAPPLLLSVGFAYTIHVMSEYYTALAEAGEGDDDAVGIALRHVTLPVLLTALTTCVGFLSLAVSPISAIREFGVFTAIGVAATVFFSLTFAPAVLWLLPVPKASKTEPGSASMSLRIERIAARVARFDLDNRRSILIGGAVVAGVALLGIARLQVSNDFLANFKSDAPLRLEFEQVNDLLDGANAFYVVLESDERDAFQEPANLHALASLQEWIEAQPGIGGTTSLADHIAMLYKSFNDDDPSYERIPDSASLVAQLMLFGSNDEAARFHDTPYRKVSISVRTSVFESGQLSDLADRIEARMEAELPDGVRGAVTGNAILVARTLDSIARGQATSLSLAFAVIYLILALLFTSFRVGLIALLPNVLPVIVYFGTLGLLGIALGPVTALGACIVLGIAVDDSIHYISRFNSESRRLIDPDKATIAALSGVAAPVTYTTVALCLGFLALTQTQLNTQILLGAVAAWTLAFAWLVDVTFTPAICSGLRVATLWDVLTLDLGAHPERTIPLFEGMRRSQARLVALLTSLRELPAGTQLCRAGEEGDEIFVVLEGDLSASLMRDGQTQELAKMGRGDIVGEVAPFYGTRTADVSAVSPVRLLVLDLRGLERIRRRYPWIGAKLYRNLSRILAHRVANTTEQLR